MLGGCDRSFKEKALPDKSVVRLILWDVLNVKVTVKCDGGKS